MPRLGKLVVGAATDDAAAKVGDSCVIQHRAECCRGEYIDVLGVNFLGRRHGRAVDSGRLRAAVRVKIANNQRRPRRP